MDESEPRTVELQLTPGRVRRVHPQELAKLQKQLREDGFLVFLPDGIKGTGICLRLKSDAEAPQVAPQLATQLGVRKLYIEEFEVD